MWKHFITDYLSFSKKERTGITVLIVLIGFFTALPYFYPFFIRQKLYDHHVFDKEIALLKIKQPDSTSANNYDPGKYRERPFSKKEYSNEKMEGTLFYFDPNTASGADWKRLGVREKTVATIQKYLSKGGKFRKPDDLGKIWGLHPAEISRLLPFVRIQTIGGAQYYSSKSFEARVNPKPAYASVIDINEADTTAWIALPGIGSKLSLRIINFRDKLGGFINVDQVSETFGLPDSTFQKIRPRLKPGNSAPRQLNINTATLEEMKSHPYLRYALSNAIVQYRTQQGSFSAVEEIKKIMIVSEEVYYKVAPYLKVN